MFSWSQDQANPQVKAGSSEMNMKGVTQACPRLGCTVLFELLLVACLEHVDW